MSAFERYLTLWVFLCIVVGILLGHAAPAVSHAIGGIEVAKVDLPVAVLIWLMIVPTLLKIDFAALRQVGDHWRGIGITLLVNWGIKPFSMAALGWFFIGHVFRAMVAGGPTPTSQGSLSLALRHVPPWCSSGATW
jgi:arsenite transporter